MQRIARRYRIEQSDVLVPSYRSSNCARPSASNRHRRPLREVTRRECCWTESAIAWKTVRLSAALQMEKHKRMKRNESLSMFCFIFTEVARHFTEHWNQHAYLPLSVLVAPSAGKQNQNNREERLEWRRVLSQLCLQNFTSPFNLAHLRLQCSRIVNNRNVNIWNICGQNAGFVDIVGVVEHLRPIRDQMNYTFFFHFSFEFQAIGVSVDHQIANGVWIFEIHSAWLNIREKLNFICVRCDPRRKAKPSPTPNSEWAWRVERKAANSRVSPVPPRDISIILQSCFDSNFSVQYFVHVVLEASHWFLHFPFPFSHFLRLDSITAMRMMFHDCTDQFSFAVHNQSRQRAINWPTKSDLYLFTCKITR